MPSLLTTIDNPFNPFSQWDDWKRFDEDHKYFTLSYLARIANVSEELSEADYNQAIDDAIDEILKLNVLGLYKRITPELEVEGPGGRV